MNFKLFLLITFVCSALNARLEMAQNTPQPDFNPAYLAISANEDPEATLDSLQCEAAALEIAKRNGDLATREDIDSAVKDHKEAPVRRLCKNVSPYAQFCLDRRAVVGALAASSALYIARRVLDSAKPTAANQEMINTLEQEIVREDVHAEGSLDKTITLLDKVRTILKKMTALACQAEEFVSKITTVIDKLIIIQKLLF